MEKQKRNKTKIIIIVLAVLLALSLCTLAGTLVYNHIKSNTETTVTVPDNLITPEEYNGDENSEPSNSSTDKTDNDTSVPADTANSGTAESKKAATISLYNKQAEDNTAFAVGNMFPGDTETKYYRVQVSYHDVVTVHYHADIRKGYEKLAEVLKVKIKLLSSDEVMYDGLMRDMPKSLTYKLSSADSTTDELYYEITAYLDTSVGNDYQNKDLVADFNWWVEETGNLDSPQTGDNSNIMLWAVIAAVSASLCIILLIYRRKKEDEAYE